MIATISIAELLKRGVSLRADEAVAVAQKLIHAEASAPIQPPFGPPGPDNVLLADDGSVTCSACAVTPAVSEIAMLLRAMLPSGTPRVPGGLRYAIARALLDVDVPPFDSIDELSHALERYEAGDRTQIVRRLVARAFVAERQPMGAGAERRRTTPSSTELRRDLRDADERLYERQHGAPPPAGRPGLRRFGAIAAGIAAGLILIGAGETMHLLRARPTAPEAIQTAPQLPPAPAAAPNVDPPPRTSARSASRPIARTIRRAPAGSSRRPVHRRTRRSSQSSVLSRLRLEWLRSAFGPWGPQHPSS